MTLLAAENISKKFADQVILDGVSFTVTQDDRIALVGKNGIGKTTLLEILAGKQRTDSGRINLSRKCHIDYVEQEKTEFLDLSLFEFVADARHDLLSMRTRIMELEEALEHDPHDNTSLSRLGELQLRFEQEGGFDFENEISIILQGLGFESERYSERMRNFSGGEKNRAGLARILAGKGSLLLLDEPTNHLDIESTVWLEEYLVKLGKACLIVSHDRAFLSAAVSEVWELADGKLDTYAGGFEKYLRERIDRRKLAEHHYRHQQEEIKRMEEFIRRNMAGQKTKQAQSRLKYLNRLKRLEPPKKDTAGPSIAMQSSGRSWLNVLKVESVALAYGARTIIQDASFDLYRGDKVGLIGRNGSGKSTLLKALIGELEPVEGSIALGNNVEVAYFDQELSDLNENSPVLDSFWRVDPSAEVGKMRSFLGRFGFTGDDVLKSVAALSGGEKTKLCLASLLYHPANLVIMDEPTNHLDMNAREALETALLEYDGSCLVVSHDRYFLQRVADRIISLENGQACVFEGRYDEFKERTLAEQPPPEAKDPQARKAYLEFREQSRERARHQRRIQLTKQKITEMENELERLEADLAHGIPRDNWEELQAASEKKKAAEASILKLYARLEELEQTEND
ncbi:MAG: ABC-F family ATP-binding cassette domain-containing protein [Candidatus Zixiibacteriota bacterium]|nr:MAG: ABC-F family ATP-binding cassette domain-containing protein [candidate division Zixibacteria bacterium]